ncbi:hypothetical protein B7494_g4983 [Chlorociboria aeruginascens]|nr:hypothetical protein B7494_g4983 [Chlorociboria aeruginascens]
MEPLLKEGDRIYLLRRHIKTKRPNDKLDFKKIRPFEIKRKTGPVNYELRLPHGSRLYPMFYVLLLEPAKGNAKLANNIEIQPENDPDIYEVEKILDTRTRTDGQQEYLVK